MRLTNVSRMVLPPGRMMSYGVRLSDAMGRPLPVSFDQGRHVGQGQRPGSWMAIAARVPAGTTPAHLQQAWWAVVQRHGTFRTGFGLDCEGRVVLHEFEAVPGEWREHPIADGVDPREVLRRLFDAACAPFEQPSHLLVVMQPDADQADARPMVIVGSDHSHVDMWSFLIVLRDLCTCLDDLHAGRPPGVGLAPVPAFAEHSAVLEARPPAPAEVHERWAGLLAAEDGVMPRFPLPLGNPAFEGDSLVEVRDLLDAGQTARFGALAAQQGVRSIALALSVIVTATRDVADAPLRVLFPVHSRDEVRWRESVGWFITNSVLECADPDPAAGMSAVKEAVALGSYPLAPIFAPYGGMPTAPGMFALSWLDTRRLPELPVDAQVQYVSAVIHDDGVMVWFIVNDTGLHLRARYPDTAAARAHVVPWLDAVERGLLAMVRTEDRLTV